MKKVIYYIGILLLTSVLFTGCSGRNKNTKAPTHRVENIYDYDDALRKDVFINALSLSTHKTHLRADITQTTEKKQYYKIKSFYNKTTRKQPDVFDTINLVNPMMLIDPKGYADHVKSVIGKTTERSKTGRKKHYTGKIQSQNVSYNGTVTLSFKGNFNYKKKFGYYVKNGNDKSSYKTKVNNGNLNVDLSKLIGRLPIPPIDGMLTITASHYGYSDTKTISLSNTDINTILYNYRSDKWSWKKYTLYEQYKNSSKEKIKKDLIGKIITYHKAKNYSASVPYCGAIEKLLNYRDIPKSFDYIYALSVWSSEDGNINFVISRLKSYLRRASSDEPMYISAKKLLDKAKIKKAAEDTK